MHERRYDSLHKKEYHLPNEENKTSRINFALSKSITLEHHTEPGPVYNTAVAMVVAEEEQPTPVVLLKGYRSHSSRPARSSSLSEGNFAS